MIQNNKRNSMKFFLPALITIVLAGCSQSSSDSKPQSQPEIETLLVCNGNLTSFIAGFGGPTTQSFIITKVGGKVTKVKSGDSTFKLDKVDVATQKNNGPIYLQLITEEAKLILRAEITEDRVNRDTVIFNSGAYTEDRGMAGLADGHCNVSTKAF